MKIDPKHPKTVKGPHNFATNKHARVKIGIFKYEGKKATVYKKVDLRSKKREFGEYTLLAYAVLKLQISAGTRAQQTRNQKCRAASAKVIAVHSVVDYFGGPEYVKFDKKKHKLVSGFDPDFEYRVGEIVRPSKPYCTKLKECAPGVHFFLDVDSASRYAL